MNSETTQPTPKLKYAAALLRKLISPVAEDPTGKDFQRLSDQLLELALAVHSEGQDETRRKARLKAELAARNLELALQPLIDIADPYVDLSTLSAAGSWQSFDLADVVNEEIPPIEWIVKYILPRPSVITMFGKPKHKKTLVVMDMCHHIASGLPWMISSPKGRDGIAVKASRVLWLDLENGTRLLKQRMKAFACALNVEIERGQFQAYSMPDPWPDLSKPENLTAMIERIQAFGGIDVLVIDHLGQVFGGIDENSPLASQIMGSIRQISEACNIAIILVHHAKKGIGKNGGSLEDQLRGSGAILAGVDGAFLIENDFDKDEITVKPVAVRGPDAPNISASFAYEQNDNLDLTSARFWRVAYRSKTTRAQDAIIDALSESKKLKYGELVAAVKHSDKSLSHQIIRDEITTLEGMGKISFVEGAKGAHIYSLVGENEED